MTLQALVAFLALGSSTSASAAFPSLLFRSAAGEPGAARAPFATVAEEDATLTAKGGWGGAVGGNGWGDAPPRRLRQWLEGLEVELPAFTVLPKRLGFAVEVAGGSCHGFRVGDIIADRKGAGHSAFEAGIQLSGLDLTCTAAATISVFGFPEQCKVSLNVENAWLALGFYVAATTAGLPSARPAPKASCKVQPELKDLKFDGRSAACEVLWAAEGAIRGLVNTFTGTVCTAVESFIEDGLVKVAAIAEELSRYAQPAPPLSPPSWMPETVLDVTEIWRNPAVVAFRAFFKQVAHDDDTQEFNEVVKRLLTDIGYISPSGVLVWPSLVPSPLPLRLPEAAVPFTQDSALLDVVVNQGRLDGVGTISEVVIEAASRHAMRAAGAFVPGGSVTASVVLRLPRGHANISAFGHVCRIFEKAPLEGVNFLISGRAKVAADTSVLVAPNRTGMASLQMDQIQDPGCADRVFSSGVQGGPVQLLQVLIALELVNMTAELAGGQQDAVLENQLLCAGRTVAAAAWDVFGEASMRLARGWMSLSGRERVNKVLLKYFESPSEQRVCPATRFSEGFDPDVMVPAMCTSLLAFGLGLLCLLLAVARACGQRCCSAHDLPDGEADGQFASAAPDTVTHGGSFRTSSAAAVGVKAAAAAAAAAAASAAAVEVAATVNGTHNVAVVSRAAAPGAGSAARPREVSNSSFFTTASDNEAINDMVQALAWSPGVPVAVRWGMVCCVTGNITLFLAATYSVGVSIRLRFEGGGDVYTLPDIAHLSLDNTIGDMMATRAYFLASVVIVFSLLWPYVKLLVMLYAWLSRMSSKTRRLLLVFLDQVGKWSLTDNFAMFLLIVLFLLDWEGVDSTAEGDSRNPASFTLKCAPDLQLTLFLMATVFSLVLGHTMLGINRWQAGEFLAVAAAAATGASREPLCRRATKMRSRRPLASSLGTTLLVLGTMVLVLCCWHVDIVEIRLGGLAGAVIDLTDQPPASRYSLLDIVEHIRTQGSAGLQAVMVVFVLALPPLYLTALLLLWVAPLGPQAQFRLLIVSQTLSAWSALDVFLVAYLGVVLGGQSFGIANFVEMVIYQQNLGPTCRALRHVGTECFKVELSMLAPVAMLILAALALNIVGSIMYRKVRDALHAGISSPCAADVAVERPRTCEASGGPNHS